MNLIELGATVCFALAIIHTFLVKHDVEIVFGLWAVIFLSFFALSKSPGEAIHYLEAQSFTEPAFVFVIMVICSTKPILSLANRLIETLSRLLPLKKQVAFYATCMVVGPLLGSFITEPAAMTVTALILLDHFYKQGLSFKLKYATLGLLFVNVSIGGTLTPYAAPPVLMVAKTWGWDLSYMLSHFGIKAATAVILSTILVTVRFQKELSKISSSKQNTTKIPIWVSLTHLIFLALVIASAHHVLVFGGLFLLFLGLFSITKKQQQELNLREALLVAFFLGGLVVLGGLQRWWIEPLFTKFDALTLFLGATSLTAITDNAALTYLGSQVPNLSEASRYALVAGAVTGGGLTVIANAPNPAGYGLLNSSFGKEGISPLHLFIHALTPTLIAALCFWLI